MTERLSIAVVLQKCYGEAMEASCGPGEGL